MGKRAFASGFLQEGLIRMEKRTERSKEENLGFPFCWAVAGEMGITDLNWSE